MEEVEASVRESFHLYENSKRNFLLASGPASKRLKIWMGKEKVDEEDSDDEDDNDEDGGEEKCVFLDDRSHLARIEDGEGCLDSVSGGILDGDSSAGCSAQSNLDEENGIVCGCFESEEVCGSGAINAPANVFVEPSSRIHAEIVSSSEAREVSGIEVVYAKKDGSLLLESICNETYGKNTSTGLVECSECKANYEENGSVKSKSGASAVLSTNISDLQISLNFDQFNTAAEMEDLCMERLKAGLQARGLKCGGTLQECAARLFLLKSTPVEMLPKNLLAKK